MRFNITFALIGFLFHGATSVLRADFIYWADVPEHVSANIDTFEQLFSSAHTQSRGITILGDSQETSPGGYGYAYVPSLGHEFYLRYGNVPKSPVAISSSYADAWMLAGSNAGVLSNSVVDVLPGTAIGTFNNTPNGYGLLAQLLTTGSNTPSIPGTSSGYFNNNPVTIEVIARTKGDSSEIAWRVNLQPGDVKSYFNGVNIGSGTTSAQLNQSSGEFVTVNIGTYNLGENKAIQAIAQGNSATSTVDIAGIRFINAGDPSGVSVQSYSAGGYRAIDFLNNRANVAGQFNAFVQDDIVAIQYGANDAGSRTAEQFKNDLETLIVRLRDWTGNPDLPILLIADPDRILTASQRHEFDQFPAVAAEIALSFENVLALNTRLIASKNGWSVGSDQFGTFVVDGVHYTQFGAQQLAKWQVDSLYSLSTVPEPSAGFTALLSFSCLFWRRNRNCHLGLLHSGN